MSKNKHEDHEDHKPLKDPAAGIPPAVVEGHDLTNEAKPLPEFTGEVDGLLTAAEEQRRRSQHMQDIGVEAYKREIASPESLPAQAPPKQVPGVAHAHEPS
jgi:hypothetical protein